VQTLLFSATLPSWVRDITKRFLQPGFKTVDLVGTDKMKARPAPRPQAVAPWAGCWPTMHSRGSRKSACTMKSACMERGHAYHQRRAWHCVLARACGTCVRARALSTHSEGALARLSGAPGALLRDCSGALMHLPGPRRRARAHRRRPTRRVSRAQASASVQHLVLPWYAATAPAAAPSSVRPRPSLRRAALLLPDRRVPLCQPAAAHGLCQMGGLSRTAQECCSVSGWGASGADRGMHLLLPPQEQEQTLPLQKNVSLTARLMLHVDG